MGALARAGLNIAVMLSCQQITIGGTSFRGPAALQRLFIAVLHLAACTALPLCARKDVRDSLCVILRVREKESSSGGRLVLLFVTMKNIIMETL